MSLDPNSFLITMRYMKRSFLLIFLIISCPRPNLQKIPEPDYLKEAEVCYRDDPVYAYNILKNNVTNPAHTNERVRIMVKIYLDQREYERAAQLLDSLNWAINLNQNEAEIILLKTKRWQKLIEITKDYLLKGVACYQLSQYQNAIEFLVTPSSPNDYRMLYLAKAYRELNDFENGLKIFMEIDSLSPYLFKEYQNLLFNLLSNIEDLNIIEKAMSKLRDPALKDYILIRLYEKKKDRKNLNTTAWQLIKNHPETEAAFYALKVVKPKTKLEHKLFGKVYYYHNDYDLAIKHLRKSLFDDDVNFYFGNIYYNREQYSKALRYFALSKRAAAYYYRGRIYESLEKFHEAILMYDSLQVKHRGSSYVNRGLKRKAFLLEDLGDTLKAVETFLNIGERNTKFRAVMQLYRVGKLEKAIEILKNVKAPEFIYWQARINERLGQPVDSLKNYLATEYPLSYYSLVINNSDIVFDTTSIENWLKQLGDTILSLSYADSLHLAVAIRYFNLSEFDYATQELNMIDTTNPQKLLYLSRLCAQYGADLQSIIYSLKLKNLTEEKNLKVMPYDLFKLLYPIRYTFSIIDQQMEMSLCLALIWQESLFDPKALSPANATGLMQIIPETARAIAHDLNISSYALNDASTSIKFGCYYFSNLLRDLNSTPLSLAGYNAGPIRLKRWLAKNPNAEIDEFIELIPYNETREYVKAILARQVIYKTLLPNSHSSSSEERINISFRD